MDFPSEDWIYNDLDDFDTAPPLIKGRSAEAYEKDSRRRHKLLHEPLEIDASLMDMISNPVFRGWRYRTQKQPSEIYIRRNMLSGVSTAWVDIPVSLLFNVHIQHLKCK
jgi:hypothetical protein